MKELNEGRFFHAKWQTCDKEFHPPTFLCCTQKSGLPCCSPPHIKDNYFSINPPLLL